MMTTTQREQDSHQWEDLEAVIEPEEASRLELKARRGSRGACCFAHGVDEEIGEVDVLYLSPEVAIDLRVRELFLTEAARLLPLRHPSLPKVHALREFQGSIAMIQACAQGQILSEMIEAGPLQVSKGLRVLMQVARVVAYLHQQGIIHCDLRPENILVTSKGTVQLLSFGIERFLDEFIGQHHHHRFRAPEEDRPEAVGATTDVFQVGLLMTEIFSGARVGEATPSAVEAQLDRANVPEPLKRLILRLTNPDIDARVINCRGVLKALQELYLGFRSDIGLRAIH